MSLQYFLVIKKLFANVRTASLCQSSSVSLQPWFPEIVHAFAVAVERSDPASCLLRQCHLSLSPAQLAVSWRIPQQKDVVQIHVHHSLA